MADGPEKDNEDKVQEILEDLDSILSIGDPAPGKSFDDVATGLGAAVPPPGNLPPKPTVPAKAPPGPPSAPKAGPPAPPPAAAPPAARPPASVPPPAARPPSALPPQSPQPPVIRPPVAGQPPVVRLPAGTPAPVSQPPAARPPAAAPPPVSQPPAARPPAAAPPPVSQPPAARPPASVPPPASTPPAAPPPAAAPAPAAPAAFNRRSSDAQGEEEIVDTVPPDAPKSQIRRIAYIYSAANRREMDVFLRNLDEAIGSVSKKPLFTRKILLAAIDESTDPLGMVSKLKGLKAVGVLAVVVNPKDPKVVELSKACEAAKIKFMIVPAPDVQKSSVLRDVAVDIMLRPSEM